MAEAQIMVRADPARSTVPRAGKPTGLGWRRSRWAYLRMPGVSALPGLPGATCLLMHADGLTVRTLVPLAMLVAGGRLSRP